MKNNAKNQAKRQENMLKLNIYEKTLKNVSQNP